MNGLIIFTFAVFGLILIAKLFRWQYRKRYYEAHGRYPTRYDVPLWIWAILLLGSIRGGSGGWGGGGGGVG